MGDKEKIRDLKEARDLYAEMYNQRFNQVQELKKELRELRARIEKALWR